MLGNVLAGLRFSRIILGGMGAYVAGSIIRFSSKAEEPTYRPRLQGYAHSRGQARTASASERHFLSLLSFTLNVKAGPAIRSQARFLLSATLRTIQVDAVNPLGAYLEKSHPWAFCFRGLDSSHRSQLQRGGQLKLRFFQAPNPHPNLRRL